MLMNPKSRILLEELSKKYPNSSLLGFIWIGYYNNIADNQKALIKENDASKNEENVLITENPIDGLEIILG